MAIGDGDSGKGIGDSSSGNTDPDAHERGDAWETCHTNNGRC